MEDRLDYLTKLARGEVDADSDSESESDNESEEQEEEDDDEEVNENEESVDYDLDEDVVYEDVESTYRLAIQNCDWENIKATDLL